MAGVDVTSPCVSSSFYLVPSSGAVTIPFCKTSRPGHVRSELDLLLDPESEHAFYAAAEGSPPARLFISNKKVLLWISLKTNV